MGIFGAAVIADISGSTSLYEGTGAQAAYDEIQARIERLKGMAIEAGGEFIHSRGDDILAYFADADAAVESAKRMVANLPEDVLDVHAGVGWGKMLRVPGDLHGAPVNTASRLASLAKPREVLIDESCFERLPGEVRAPLRRVDVLRLKGAADNRAVLSYVADDPAEQTHLFFARLAGRSDATRLLVEHAGTRLRLNDGDQLKVGRSSENGLVVMAPWVSRTHATIALANGLVEFRDHSTGGSYLVQADGEETVVRRASVTLSGRGTISLGAAHPQAGAAVLSFAVDRGGAAVGQAGAAELPG